MNKIMFKDGYRSKDDSALFESTIDYVTNARDKFDELLKTNGKVTLNEWYDCLGIDHVDIGDDLVFYKIDEISGVKPEVFLHIEPIDINGSNIDQYDEDSVYYLTLDLNMRMDNGEVRFIRWYPEEKYE